MASLLSIPSASQTPSPSGEGKGRARTRNFLLRSRNTHTAALAKKILQKDFLRRGAASVSGVLFGKAEQSQMALRRDEPLDEKIRELLIQVSP